VDGVVGHYVEPVYAAGRAENLAPVGLRNVDGVGHAVKGVEAVGGAFLVDPAAQALVLETLREAVEPSGHRVGVNLYSTDLAPGGGGALAGPIHAVGSHIAPFVEHANEPLAVHLLEVRADRGESHAGVTRAVGSSVGGSGKRSDSNGGRDKLGVH